MPARRGGMPHRRPRRRRSSPVARRPVACPGKRRGSVRKGAPPHGTRNVTTRWRPPLGPLSVSVADRACARLVRPRWSAEGERRSQSDPPAASRRVHRSARRDAASPGRRTPPLRRRHRGRRRGNLRSSACRPHWRPPKGRADRWTSRAPVETAPQEEATHDSSQPITGPVEWIALAFPGQALNAAIAPALAELVDSGTVRVLDAAVLYIATDGRVTEGSSRTRTALRSARSTAMSSSSSATRT